MERPDASEFDLEHQSSSTDSKIIVALERVSQAFRVLLWQESKEHALSPIQVQVLIFLLFHDADKRKVSYLASEFNVTKATISDTVKSLEQKQLIRREPEPNDSRSHIIHLTPAGVQAARQTSSFAHEIRQPLAQMPAEDKAKLLQQLLQIIHHLHTAGVITIQRMCLTCAHYQARHPSAAHYCHLLAKPLHVTDLRVDCPEHVMAGA